MDYTALTPVHLRADNEYELQKKIYELKSHTQKMPNIITIYPRGSYVYAWLFLDERQLGAVPTEEKIQPGGKLPIDPPAKKKIKKKVTKKVK